MGDNSTSSTSTPLTGEQREAIYSFARKNLQNEMPGPDAYQAPTMASTRGPQTLSNGDYNRLEENIRNSKYSGLDRAWDQRKSDINQDAADRGIWASGVPTQVMAEEYRTNFAPQYAAAASDAATQRYALQSGENKDVNAYDLNAANQINAFNLNRADKAYESKWRRADYNQGLWNQTGGAVSSSSGGGWSI